MTWRRRLARLERARGGAHPARDRLAELLARVEGAVVASGDARDRPGASPVERMVRRYLRGDATLGDALRAHLAGRWP